MLDLAPKPPLRSAIKAVSAARLKEVMARYGKTEIRNT
jgi:hypothetical protein